MKILLTNDDGVSAPGLAALRARLRRLGEVVVVAPDRERSAIGNAITLRRPIRVRRSRAGGVPCCAVDGTPADAAKLALTELLDPPPDLVVSGINHGLNTGSDILYSGTVAAALEGALAGVRSFAVSVKRGEGRPDFPAVARSAVALIRKLLPAMPPGGLCNINFPPGPPRGTLVTRQERRAYRDAFEKRGRAAYLMCGGPGAGYAFGPESRGGVPTDAWAVSHGYVSVTPLRRDLTDRRLLSAVRRKLGKKK
ncbi:MAG: 5'/3'-nucleotidase SurE [Planctomycetota bacterium]|jgi:5'-nucleotidase